MAALVCLLLLMAIFGVSDGAWCVCRSDVGDSSLQKAIDYACGNGADCTSIAQGGSCYNPNTVRNHCSYAVNSYYQKKGQNQQACDFSGAATLTNSDPSVSTCTFPATSSGTGTSTPTPPTTTSPPGSSTTTPGSSTTTPGSGTTMPGSSTTPPGSTTTTPSSTTPSTGLTPTTGTGGGILGLGPSGSSVSTDSSGSGLFPNAGPASLLSLIVTVAMLRG